MTFDFTGKTALVTGAAHGFGRAIAKAFADRGAHVWACDVLDAELAETATLCRHDGGECDVFEGHSYRFEEDGPAFCGPQRRSA